MAKVDNYPRLARIAKKLVVLGSSVTSRAPIQRKLALLEMLCAILQGKGSGSGWDMNAETKAALPFMTEGAIIFDVGANRGDWSVNLNQKSKVQLNFFLFEPQASCQQDLERLPLSRKVVVNAAVGDTSGFAMLYSPGPRSSVASLYDRRDTPFERRKFSATAVSVITLDEFILSNGISEVDYLKIDVEGHELQVLRGCCKSLSQGKVKAISFEFGSGNMNSRTYFKDIWEFMTRFNYNIRRILPGGKCHQVEEYYEDLEYFRGVSNYQAVRNKVLRQNPHTDANVNRDANEGIEDESANGGIY